MSDVTKTSFTYDPIRQGYDTNSWRTTAGAPAISGGRLFLDNGVGIEGTAVHYADFLKGDINFNVNVPAAPAGSGDIRYFGVSSPSSGGHIRFAIDSALTCQTSDGVTSTESGDITWDSAWTGVNVNFRIRWEAGTAKFFINGTQVYAISDNSVPTGTMSLYLFDNSSSSMSVGTIDVRGAQSFVMNPKSSDSTLTVLTGTLVMSQLISIAESITFRAGNYLLPESGSPGFFESVAIAENIAFFNSHRNARPDELLTVTESVTVVRV